jgi:hypothetical protein
MIKTFAEIANRIVNEDELEDMKKRNIERVKKSLSKLIKKLPKEYTYEYTVNGVTVSNKKGQFITEIKPKDTMEDVKAKLAFAEDRIANGGKKGIMDLGNIDWSKQSKNGWTGD